MTTTQIRKATKKMTFENANYFIENSGLQLELQENYPFLKSWIVKNNKEITRLSNCKKDLINGMAEVTFAFNY
jgi:hypothetical protein